MHPLCTSRCSERRGEPECPHGEPLLGYEFQQQLKTSLSDGDSSEGLYLWAASFDFLLRGADDGNLNLICLCKVLLVTYKLLLSEAFISC